MKFQQVDLRKSLLCGTMLAVATIAMCPSAHAKDSFFISVSPQSISVEGDFDGITTFSGGGSTEFIPMFDPGIGYGISVGGQSGTLGYELGYVQADLDGQWQGIDSPGEYSSFYMDIKFMYREVERISPFIVGGVGFRSLDTIEGTTDGVRLETATFKGGVDWRIGGGISFELSKQFAINLQGVYRFSEFDEVDAIASGELSDPLDASGATFSVGFAYVFGQ